MIKQTNSAPSLYKEGSFTVTVKNFGKIQEAKLQFKDLTILAGPNNTGKSYVSKVLYSIFSTMNTKMDPITIHYLDVLNKFNDTIKNLSGDWSMVPGVDKRSFRIHPSVIDDFIADKVTDARKSITNRIRDDSDPIQENKNAAKVINKLIAEEDSFIDCIKASIKEQYNNQADFKKVLISIQGHLLLPFGELKTGLVKDYKDIMQSVYEAQIANNLKDNFQVKRLSSLIGRDKQANASIEIQFEKGSNVLISIDQNGRIAKLLMDFNELTATPKAFYLESPTLWKLKDALMELRLSDNFRTREYLTGVPGYLYDLVRLISLNKIPEEDNMSIVNLAEKINNIIGGKIIIDDNTKELKFIEDDEDGNPLPALSLLLTATGVVQLGIVGYLMENQIIEKGSILFIDEPEAHLHPGWQEDFTEILYELAKHGVKVIIATHSTVVMQKLELLIDDKNSEKSIWLNFFHPSGKFNDVDRDFIKIRDDIAISLNDPAYMMLYRKNRNR